GNVRELENVIERMLVLLEGSVIRPSDIPVDIREGIEVETPQISEPALKTVPIDYKEARVRFETEYLKEILDKTNGSVSEAARISGMSRRNLYEKMEKLGLQSQEFKK
ncbi:sigma-54-dependent Fis family transcriptional regulator, partial [Candidatus Sumerlaeota bacterium]|nr:sigma-54-dependent Fis family transcriptional regulator [Candidatus Sumerlaeota bacterium]